MDTSLILSSDIKAEARNLGFFACGIARAGLVDEVTASEYRRWIAVGGNADMRYMARNMDKRLDPRLLMHGARSIVCVALSYAPARRMPAGEYQIASYAYGVDYHGIVKSRLHQLAANLNITNYRAFCDSSPVMERYWAARAGLGWIGRNRQLIIPRAGGMFFLGELLVDFELAYDTPQKGHCGTCRSCVDACPTGALPHAEDDRAFCAGKCLSYQTIENHGAIPDDIATKIGNRIYGCDECLLACPWNRFATPNSTPGLRPSEELMAMTKGKWLNLDEETYRRLFKGSAVKRAKYDGLMRNIRAVTSGEKSNLL